MQCFILLYAALPSLFSLPSNSPPIPLQFPHPRHGQHHAQTLHRAQRNPPFWPGQRSLQRVRTVAPHTTTRDRTQRVTVRPRQPHRSAHCRGAQVPAIRPQFGAAVGSSENVLATGSRPSASYQRSTLNLPEATPASPAPAWGLGLEWVLTAWREGSCLSAVASVRLSPCGCLSAWSDDASFGRAWAKPHDRSAAAQQCHVGRVNPQNRPACRGDPQG